MMNLESYLQRLKAHERGFTLIEVMMTIAIFSIVMLGVLGLSGQLISLQSQTQQLSLLDYSGNLIGARINSLVRTEGIAPTANQPACFIADTCVLFNDDSLVTHSGTTLLFESPTVPSSLFHPDDVSVTSFQIEPGAGLNSLKTTFTLKTLKINKDFSFFSTRIN